MADNSNIEWTDATWTPIRAHVKVNAGEIAKAKNYTSLVNIATRMAGHVGPHCERVSPGCENCYSETNNHRCLPNNGTGLPFDRRSRDLVDIFVDDDILMQPLKWKTPKKVFVCSQTDLFGEWVPDEVIDRVFAVMALCPQHAFQVLTKRAERMRNYMGAGLCGMDLRRRVQDVLSHYDESETLPRNDKLALELIDGWPLPNVYLGVSVENQEQADERIPLLLQTPTAVRWISAEPLLGPVDLSSGFMIRDGVKQDALYGREGLRWVVVGGESGPGARPMDEAWMRALVSQCRDTKVPVFVKQMGSVPMESEEVWRGRARTRILCAKNHKRVPEGFVPTLYRDHGNIDEFPADLRIREYPA